jgi:hypothetical protein
MCSRKPLALVAPSTLTLTTLTLTLSLINLVAPIRVAQAAGEPETPSVYALPTPPTEKEGTNLGGINLSAEVRYMTNYIYRGVNVTELLGDVTTSKTNGGANFQFEGYLSFNLDKLPHPFIGIFTNVLASDPVSNFEEVRPMFGADWQVRPFVFTLATDLYEYPNRSDAGTGDVWLKILLDDAAVLHNEKPLLSPYILASFDYDKYKGWYFEAGVSHDFVIEGTGLTLTPLARVAYVTGDGEYELSRGKDTGFQHYDVGLTLRYNINTLLNIPQRYGKWNLTGYVYYTDGLDSDLRAATKTWGGAGIELKY